MLLPICLVITLFYKKFSLKICGEILDLVIADS